MQETNRYSAAEAAALIAAGKLTALKLAEDCLARIAAREEAVQAWAYIDPQQVLADVEKRLRALPDDARLYEIQARAYDAAGNHVAQHRSHA